MKTINWDEVKPQEITLEDLENSVIKPYTYGRGAWRCAQAMYKIYKQHQRTGKKGIGVLLEKRY